MRQIKGGWELQILGGVMHINTRDGSVLRITGLPRDLSVDVSDPEGRVVECMNGA